MVFSGYEFSCIISSKKSPISVIFTLWFRLSFLHRLLLKIGISQKFTISWDLTITYEMAKAYRKAHGGYLRENQWEDITMVMCLEIGK
ncbi:MAG: hypothetical protein LKG21_05235 [Ruminococcus sp.]|nr:hypothetical protein [Ruminococcus sp.]